MALITGNTYPHREALRALGGKWNRRAKGWEVPDDKAEEASYLCREVMRDPRFVRDGVSTYTRFSSGAEVYTNRRGRCEDAPCCGCCT